MSAADKEGCIDDC